MAQNSHRTELILMFEKITFGILFGITYKKTNLMLKFEPATYRFGRFYEKLIFEGPRIDTFFKVSGIKYTKL